MKCPICNEILKRIAHVIVESPVDVPLDKTGIRRKEVKILGVDDKMYFCKNGHPLYGQSNDKENTL